MAQLITTPMPSILLTPRRPAPLLRSFSQLTSADFCPDWPGLTSNYVEGFLGRDSIAELYRIEHGQMDYGTHWRWSHGQQFYTIAGLLLIVEELRKLGQPGPALQLATHARQCDALHRARQQCDEAKAAEMAARRLGEVEADDVWTDHQAIAEPSPVQHYARGYADRF